MLYWNVVLILFTMSIMSKTQTWSEVAQLAVHDGRRGVRLGRPSGILAAALCDGISGWRQSTLAGPTLHGITPLPQLATLSPPPKRVVSPISPNPNSGGGSLLHHLAKFPVGCAAILVGLADNPTPVWCESFAVAWALSVVAVLYSCRCQCWLCYVSGALQVPLDSVALHQGVNSEMLESVVCSDGLQSFDHKRVYSTNSYLYRTKCLVGIASATSLVCHIVKDTP